MSEISPGEYTHDELIELYEERAAIMEYDGGIDRLEAQRLAYWDWRHIVGPKTKVPKQIQSWFLEHRNLWPKNDP